MKILLLFFSTVILIKSQLSMRYSYTRLNSEKFFAGKNDANFSAGEKRPFDIFNGGTFTQNSHTLEIDYQANTLTTFSLKLPFVNAKYADKISSLNDSGLPEFLISVKRNLVDKVFIGAEYRHAFKNRSIQLSLTEASKDFTVFAGYETLLKNQYQNINLKQSAKYKFRSNAIDRDIVYGNEFDLRSELGFPYRDFYPAFDLAFKYKEANYEEDIKQNPAWLVEQNIKLIYMIRKDINIELLYAASISGRDEIVYNAFGFKFYLQLDKGN